MKMFRLWDEQNNRFHYWGFIDSWFQSIPNGFGMKYAENNSEQYTGLKDWYSGDILKSFSHTDCEWNGFYLYHVIIYSEEYTAFMAIDKTNYENGNFNLHNGNVLLYQMIKFNAEKVGNIHENNGRFK